MFPLAFTFRRIARHWRINLLVLLGLALTGALVASLPAFAAAIAADGLEKNLALEPPFSRNLLVTAPPSVSSFNAALARVFDDDLGFLTEARLEVRFQAFEAYRSLDGTPAPGIDPVPL